MGKHRRPAQVPPWVMSLCMLLGIGSLFASAPFHLIFGGLAACFAAVYFVQKWRQAGWIVNTATKVTDRG